jgi:hypothetical protein
MKAKLFPFFRIKFLFAMACLSYESRSGNNFTWRMIWELMNLPVAKWLSSFRVKQNLCGDKIKTIGAGKSCDTMADK